MVHGPISADSKVEDYAKDLKVEPECFHRAWSVSNTLTFVKVKI